LIAGVIDGVFDILRIEADGSVTRKGETGQAFIGSGGVQATTAWHVAAALVGYETLRQREPFETFFASTCEHVGYLGGPIQLWGVDARTATLLSEPVL
jgi:hypothetical protein